MRLKILFVLLLIFNICFSQERKRNDIIVSFKKIQTEIREGKKIRENTQKLEKLYNNSLKNKVEVAPELGLELIRININNGNFNEVIEKADEIEKKL